MKIIHKNLYLIILFFLILIFYYPFFFKNLLPIPSDILTGVYFPWLDLQFEGYPTGVPVKNPTASDIVSLTYPLRLISIESIKKGVLPLWNSYILNGTPLLAGFQAASLYPLNLLYLLSQNFSFIWSVQVILQPILSYLFMYLFLKNLKFTSISSIIGSVCWAFSSYFSLWQQYNTLVHCYLYLPLLLYCVDTISTRKIFKSIVIAFSIMSSIYAGNPPVSLITFLVVGSYSVFRYFHQLNKIIYIGISSCLGILFSAPILVPNLITNFETIRSFDQVVQAANIKYLPLHKLITLISPSFYGHPSTINYWEKIGSFDNLTIYFGILPLFVFLIVLFSKKNSLIKFSYFMIFFAFIFILKNPLSAFAGNVKFLGLNSMVMTRLTIIPTFFISIILSYYLNQPQKYSSNKKIIFVCLILLVSIALSIFLVYRTQPVEYFKVTLRNILLPIMLIFLTSLLLLLISKTKIISGLILLSLVFDLFYFFRKYNSFNPSKFLYPNNQITTYLKQNSNRFISEPAEIMPPNTWLGYQLSSSNGQDTLHSLRYNQFIAFVNNQNLESFGNRYVQINNLNSQFLDFLGIDHIIAIKRTQGKPDSKGSVSDVLSNYPIVFESGCVAILKNNNSFSNLFSVKDYFQSTDISQTQPLLVNSNLAETVILERSITLPLSLCEITNINYSQNQFSFQTNSTNHCLVVSNTTYHPNWHLYINNQISDQLFIANHAFMAFLLPPGQNSNIVKFSLW